jgi:hypothetical protein
VELPDAPKPTSPKLPPDDAGGIPSPSVLGAAGPAAPAAPAAAAPGDGIGSATAQPMQVRLERFSAV